MSVKPCKFTVLATGETFDFEGIKQWLVDNEGEWNVSAKKPTPSIKPKNYTEIRDEITQALDLNEEEQNELIGLLPQFGITKNNTNKANTEGYELLLNTKQEEIADGNGKLGQKVADWVKGRQAEMGIEPKSGDELIQKAVERFGPPEDNLSKYLPPNQMNDIGTVVAGALRFAKDYITYHGGKTLQKGIEALKKALEPYTKRAAQIARAAFNRAARPTPRATTVQDPNLAKHIREGEAIRPKRFEDQQFAANVIKGAKEAFAGLRRRYPKLNATTFASAIELMQRSFRTQEQIAIGKTKEMMDGWMKTLKTEADKNLFFDFAIISDMKFMAESDLFNKEDDFDFYTTYDGKPISKQAVKAEFARLEAEVENNPVVKKAIEERRKTFDKVLRDARERGLININDANKNPYYLHHMVLNYRSNKFQGAGLRAANNFSQPFIGQTVKRKKTSSAYSPNVIAADFVSLVDMQGLIDAYDKIVKPLKSLYTTVTVETLAEAQKAVDQQIKDLVNSGAPQEDIDRLRENKKEAIDAVFQMMMQEKGYVEVEMSGTARFTTTQQAEHLGIDEALQDFFYAAGTAMPIGAASELKKLAYKALTGRFTGETMWIPAPLAETLAQEKARAIPGPVGRFIDKYVQLYKRTKLASVINIVRFFTQNLTSNAAAYLFDKNLYGQVKNPSESAFSKGVKTAWDIIAKKKFDKEVEKLLDLRLIDSQADLESDRASVAKAFDSVDWSRKNAWETFAKYFFAGEKAVSLLDTLFKLATYYEVKAQLDRGVPITRVGGVSQSNLDALQVLQESMGNDVVAAKIAREKYGDAQQASYVAQQASKFAVPFIRFTQLMVSNTANSFLNVPRSIMQEEKLDRKIFTGAKNLGELGIRLFLLHAAAFLALDKWNEQMLSGHFDDDDEEEDALNTWKATKQFGTVIVGFDDNNNPVTTSFDTWFTTALRALGVQQIVNEMAMKENLDFKPDVENPILAYTLKPQGSNSDKVRLESQWGALGAKVFNDAMMNAYSMTNPFIQIMAETMSGKRMDYNKMAFVPEYKSAYGSGAYNASRLIGVAPLMKLKDSELAETILDYLGVDYMPSYKQQSVFDDLNLTVLGLRREDINKNLVFRAKQILQDKFASSPTEYSVSSKDSGPDNTIRNMKEAQGRLFKAVIEGADVAVMERLLEKYKQFGGDKKTLKRYLESKDVFSGINKADEKAIMDYLGGNDEAFVVNKAGNNVYVSDLLDKTEAKIIAYALNLQEKTGASKEDLKELVKKLETE